jgi:hypothetical protein
MRCNVTGCRIVASEAKRLVDTPCEQVFVRDLSWQRPAAPNPEALWDNGRKVCRMMRRVQHRWFA